MIREYQPSSPLIAKPEMERAAASLKVYYLPEQERLALIAKDPPKMALHAKNKGNTDIMHRTRPSTKGVKPVS